MSKLKNFLPALLKKEQEEKEEEEEQARLEAHRKSKPNKEELKSKCRKREMNAIFTGKARLNPTFTQRYKLLELLGEGAFGFVFAATRLKDQKPVAVKFMIRDKVPRHAWVEDRVLGRVPNEITILHSIDHPNVIKYVEHVMPGEETNRLRNIFAQIAFAVSYLNKKGYVHRDLNDENIVVDENYHAKLIEFGSAAVIPKLKKKFFNYFNGTMHYASPEICSGETYQGPEAEVWTLGILLYTIMFAENPFKDREEILNGDYSFPKPISSDCGNLIDQLEWDPEDRITIDQVIEHPWIGDKIKKLQSAMSFGSK
ncbi:hypothetical protein HK098_005731 [Nowakowskiella sp. JEL0407]|nr:hypothetical protein HK098_005731 [Nowakowskiella sp. JEL0407]